MKTQIAKITNNPVGSIAGGVVGYYAAKRMGKVTNMWLLAGITVAGVVVGAMVQSTMKAKAGAPTSATIKK